MTEELTDWRLEGPNQDPGADKQPVNDLLHVDAGVRPSTTTSTAEPQRNTHNQTVAIHLSTRTRILNISLIPKGALQVEIWAMILQLLVAF